MDQDPQNPPPRRDPRQRQAVWLGAGIVIGAGAGIALDNLALGAAQSVVQSKRDKSE